MIRYLLAIIYGCVSIDVVKSVCYLLWEITNFSSYLGCVINHEIGDIQSMCIKSGKTEDIQNNIGCIFGAHKPSSKHILDLLLCSEAKLYQESMP
jgi:hypothetical protein